MPDPDRRQLLQWAAATAMLTGCQPGARPADPAETSGRSAAPTEPWAGTAGADLQLFPAGVTTGDPTDSGTIFWTRYLGSDALTLATSTWDGSSWTPQVERVVEPGSGGFVHVDLDDLGADTWVSYQFVDATGAGSPVGQMVTAPAADAEVTVRFCATSCTKLSVEEGFPNIAHAVGRGPTDLLFLLGDTCYMDEIPTDLEAFREAWTYNLTKPGYADTLPTTSMVATWDDHEVGDNFDITTADPERVAIARQSWFEHLAVRRQADPQRIWRGLRYGKTMEVFVLDCRGERDPTVGQYISVEQMNWLKEGLASSDAVWKVVANSVPITDVDNALMDVPLARDDRWEGFEDQRSELMDHIAAESVTGVLFVSGDVHCAWFAHADRDGPGRNVLDMACGPAGSSRNMAAVFFADDDQMPFAWPLLNTVRFELRADGTGRIEVVDDTDQTVASATLTVDGEILDLQHIELTVE